jgi:hypothetical protein
MEGPAAGGTRQLCFCKAVSVLSTVPHDALDADECMQKAYQFVWPSLVCADPEMSLRHKASRQRAALEDRFVFHAQISNAAGSRLHLIPPENESASLLRQVKAYHERRSFQAIAHCLENTPGSPPDAVILASTLTIWPASTYDASTSRYPVSPLTYGQNLDFFSNMNLSSTVIQHIHNFYRLLETRGGIDGLAQVCQKQIVSL